MALEPGLGALVSGGTGTVRVPVLPTINDGAPLDVFLLDGYVLLQNGIGAMWL